ncbi:hypothetical protein BS78_04G029800 [Paspalum vaginatum]|nr:hypothetical protein BS78_04G029800 [Paspalum vaginatum]
MSAAAAAMAPLPRLDSVLSFGDAAAAEDEARRPAAFSDDGSDDDDEEFAFEFAFAPPLEAPGGRHCALAPADDLFSHGRIVPAYPVFDRHLLDDAEAAATPASPRPSTSSPPSRDTYCDWAPRSAPGSPSRAAFPKSASAGEARRHHWRLRDLVGGRSRSDGKEKFVFLQPAADKQAAATKPPSAEAPQKQSKKKAKGGSKLTTEMDMATAHRLFYGGKQQQGAGGALPGDRRQQQQQSYLPYRPAIVGFFATAHALGRSRHAY